jgi:hypothetical protein
MIALSTYEQGAAEATDWMKPSAWTGNFWGPAATHARAAGQLPPLPMNPAMARWRRWGRSGLREGDIIFRLGDSRTLRYDPAREGHPESSDIPRVDLSRSRSLE